MASNNQTFLALAEKFPSKSTLTGPLSTNIAKNGRKLPKMPQNGSLPPLNPQSDRILTKMPKNGIKMAKISENAILPSKMPQNGTKIPTMAHIPVTPFAAKAPRVPLTRPLDSAPAQKCRPTLAYAPHGADACETLTTKRGRGSATNKEMHLRRGGITRPTKFCWLPCCRYFTYRPSSTARNFKPCLIPAPANRSCPLTSPNSSN